MKITAIISQRNRASRFSVFIDGRYEFSLSNTAVLESKLIQGQTVTTKQMENLKAMASEDSIYDQVSTYAARRLRTKWETAAYLEKLNASPALTESILNKLSNIGLIDDAKYAAAYIHDRQAFRPTSRRTISMELHNKHIPAEVVEQVLGNEQAEESTALQSLITRKRKQSRYQDDTKLIQYLVRQGFNYYDIKSAIDQSDTRRR